MAELEYIFRWLHFLAGITWIGLLYFFNLVNAPFNRVLDPSARPFVIPTLMPRALAWFRHAAWVTALAGLIMIYLKYWQFGWVLQDATFSGTERQAATITVGGILGLIMLANVWFIIWPNQRKIIQAVREKQTADPSWARNALYASRTNFALSFPMLLFMGGASHYPMTWVGIIITGIVAGAIGFVVVMYVQKWGAANF